MSATLFPATHRERKKLATRQAIHDSAFELVDRHGLTGTTIEAISETAGVAPRTFWSYYGSKEDAVIDRSPGTIVVLADALVNRPGSEDALTALRHVLVDYFSERLTHSERALRRQQLIRREPQLMAAVAAAFDEAERILVAALGERQGVDPVEDLGPGVLVAAAFGACRVAQHRWVDLGGRRPFPELVDEAFARLTDGMTIGRRKAAKVRTQV